MCVAETALLSRPFVMLSSQRTVISSLTIKTTLFLFTSTKLYSHGDERIRTADPLRARQVFSQLNYAPACRPELSTPRLVNGCATGLRSYGPTWI